MALIQHIENAMKEAKEEKGRLGPKDFIREDRYDSIWRLLGAARYLLTTLDLLELGLDEAKKINEDELLQSILKPKPRATVNPETTEKRSDGRPRVSNRAGYTQADIRVRRTRIMTYLKTERDWVDANLVAERTGIDKVTCFSDLRALFNKRLVKHEKDGRISLWKAC